MRALNAHKIMSGSRPRAAGGCDPTLLVMEEADLCIRFHRLGRTRLVNRVVITSDRRVGRMAPGLAGLRVGAFWEPGDPALISLPGPAWLGRSLNRPLVDRQKQVTAPWPELGPENVTVG